MNTLNNRQLREQLKQLREQQEAKVTPALVMDYAKVQRENADLREQLRLANESGIKCPFCHETDFDEVGLKMHFTRFGCEAFDKLSCDVPTTRQSSMKGTI